MLEVDDDKASEENMGTLDYVEREFGWLEQSGIRMHTARILDDDDDKSDVDAIELANKILKGRL